MDRIKQLKAEIEEAFGKELTMRQLWTLVKLCKHVRLRARNNAAFNNLFNALFSPHGYFRQVTKTHADGSSYPGLEIIVKDEVSSEQEEEV